MNDSIDLQSLPGEVRLTIQITRAATGKTETYDLVGKVLPEPIEEEKDVTDTQHGG